MAEHQIDSTFSESDDAATAALAAELRRARADLLVSIRAKLGEHLRADITAEDILHESILVLLAAEGGGAALDDASLRRRIVVIAENRIRSLARRREHSAAPVEEPSPHLADGSDLAARGDVRLELGEIRNAVRRHLAELPLEQRMVIVMRHWLGTSWETIAAVLGRTSVHAAHCLHYRALLALERKLQAERPNRDA